MSDDFSIIPATPENGKRTNPYPMTPAERLRARRLTTPTLPACTVEDLRGRLKLLHLQEFRCPGLVGDLIATCEAELKLLEGESE